MNSGAKEQIESMKDVLENLASVRGVDYAEAITSCFMLYQIILIARTATTTELPHEMTVGSLISQCKLFARLLKVSDKDFSNDIKQIISIYEKANDVLNSEKD